MNKGLIIGLAGVIVIIAVVVLTAGDDTASMMNDDTVAMQPDTSMDDTTSDNQGVMVGGALMVQELDIVDNAVNASNVTTLVAAVSAAGLVDTLKGPGPFTVFAPNNDAFAALPDGTVDTLLMVENRSDLVNILTYHVVPGQFTSAQLMDGMELTTVQGEIITIGKTNGQLSVNGTAMVETADVISSNGVTFVIDAVLLPPAE
jgi:uncharacterized surface protein with fasciclin (FAS1) repeats